MLNGSEMGSVFQCDNFSGLLKVLFRCDLGFDKRCQMMLLCLIWCKKNSELYLLLSGW